MRDAMAYAKLIAEVLSKKVEIVPLSEVHLLVIDCVIDSLHLDRPERSAILKFRYGLEGEKRTLKQLGKEFNVTPDRIRQIERRDIHKLRKNEILFNYFQLLRE